MRHVTPSCPEGAIDICRGFDPRFTSVHSSAPPEGCGIYRAFRHLFEAGDFITG
jgi:hypothetical protein